MLEKVKLALRISTDAFNDELNDLIGAAQLDLGIAGIDLTQPAAAATPTDKLLIRAIITYCKLNFGSPDEYDRLKASYDEQKAQLGMATGYTNWGE